MLFSESIDLLVVLDPPRSRYRLLVPIPSADATRTAQIAAIRKYVRAAFIKYGRPDPGAFDPAALTADANGWFTP